MPINRKMHPSHNESGFSLVEVMIAGAIMTVLALAITTLMFSMGKQQNTTKEKADWYEFQQQLTSDLKSKPL